MHTCHDNLTTEEDCEVASAPQVCLNHCYPFSPEGRKREKAKLGEGKRDVYFVQLRFKSEQ